MTEETLNRAKDLVLLLGFREALLEQLNKAHKFISEQHVPSTREAELACFSHASTVYEGIARTFTKEELLQQIEKVIAETTAQLESYKAELDSL